MLPLRSDRKSQRSKLTSTKAGRLKVTWKKDTKATGYQIVIAKNKKFTSGKNIYGAYSAVKSKKVKK